MRRHLPVLDHTFLDDLRIATPCSAEWSRMPGDERVRSCPDCRLRVYNVSQMTRPEAAALLRAHEGSRVCLRLYRRADGTLITQDCWERLRAARRRGLVAFGVTLAIILITHLGIRIAGLQALLAWAGDELSPDRQAQEMVLTGLRARPELADVPGIPVANTVDPTAPMMGEPPPPPAPVKGKKAKKARGHTRAPEPEPQALMGDIEMGF